MKKIFTLLIMVCLITNLGIGVNADGLEDDWDENDITDMYEGFGSLENFAKINDYKGQFQDVESSFWGYLAISKCYELGLLKGSSDTSFSPHSNITLAQSITIASRIHSIYNTGSENFIQGSVWYESYVNYALENGIIESPFDDYNRSATRKEFAEILSKSVPVMELYEINFVEAGVIPDVSDDDARIYLLYRAGILTGSDSQGSFMPEKSISRAEAGAIAARIVDESLRKSIELGPGGR